MFKKPLLIKSFYLSFNILPAIYVHLLFLPRAPTFVIEIIYILFSVKLGAASLTIKQLIQGLFCSSSSSLSDFTTNESTNQRGSASERKSERKKRNIFGNIIDSKSFLNETNTHSLAYIFTKTMVSCCCIIHIYKTLTSKQAKMIYQDLLKNETFTFHKIKHTYIHTQSTLLICKIYTYTLRFFWLIYF